MNSLKIHDENRNTADQKNAVMKKFLSIIKLQDYPGVTLDKSKITNIMHSHTNTEFSQVDIKLKFPLNFFVCIKVSLPKLQLNDGAMPIAKLRININDINIKQEIRSYTNYLQRQRSMHLTLSVLNKFASLIGERKLILDMLTLHGEGFITNEIHDDGGILIKCEDKRSNFKFFESQWQIHFNYRDHLVVDYIDFSVNIRNQLFHDIVIDEMNMLIRPQLPYDEKVELWSKILQALKYARSKEIFVDKSLESRDFLRVRSIHEINAFGTEQFEIIDESDDENCIVIDD